MEAVAMKAAFASSWLDGAYAAAMIVDKAKKYVEPPARELVCFGALCGLKPNIIRSPKCGTSGLMHQSKDILTRSLHRRAA
jgi:hypothetical protein